jgi:hypothetical protein
LAEPFPKQALSLMCLKYMHFKNTVEKGEIAHHEQFILFHTVFYLFEDLPAIFIKFEVAVCKLFQFENLSLGQG